MSVWDTTRSTSVKAKPPDDAEIPSRGTRHDLSIHSSGSTEMCEFSQNDCTCPCFTTDEPYPGEECRAKLNVAARSLCEQRLRINRLLSAKYEPAIDRSVDAIDRLVRERRPIVSSFAGYVCRTLANGVADIEDPYHRRKVLRNFAATVVRSAIMPGEAEFSHKYRTSPTAAVEVANVVSQKIKWIYKFKSCGFDQAIAAVLNAVASMESEYRSVLIGVLGSKESAETAALAEVATKTGRSIQRVTQVFHDGLHMLRDAVTQTEFGKAVVRYGDKLIVSATGSFSREEEEWINSFIRTFAREDDDNDVLSLDQWHLRTLAKNWDGRSAASLKDITLRDVYSKISEDEKQRIVSVLEESGRHSRWGAFFAEGMSCQEIATRETPAVTTKGIIKFIKYWRQVVWLDPPYPTCRPGDLLMKYLQAWVRGFCCPNAGSRPNTTEANE